MKTLLDSRRQEKKAGVPRIVSRQGWIAIPLIIVAALCFLDQDLKAVDVQRPSWFLVLGLSFPIGWVALWLALRVTELVSLGGSPLGLVCVFITGAAGTAVNLFFWAAFAVWCFRRLGDTTGGTRGRITESEFQTLLEAHRKENAESSSRGNSHKSGG